MIGGVSVASDPWVVLGIANGATEDEVQAAYRRRARECHPDLHPDNPRAVDEFRQVREAYSALKHRASEPPLEPEPEPDPLDVKGVVDNLFGDKRARRSTAPPPKAPKRRSRSRAGSMGMSFSIPFDAAVLGGDHVLEVPGQNGVGSRKMKITLPPGVESDDMFRIQGEVLRARIAPHAWFSRDGDDVLVDLPLTLAELTFGASVRIPTVHGSVEVSVPAGTNPGKRLRLKGKGVPGKGDQHCLITLAPPDQNDPEIRAALVALHHRDRSSPRPWDPVGTETKVDGLD